MVRDILRVVSAHGLQAVTSLLVVVVLPLYLGPRGYGYFQLYLLYASFAGMFQFGYLDGLLLRVAGAHSDQLDASLLSGQFRVLVSVQLAIVAILVSWGLGGGLESEQAFVIVALGVTIFAVGVRGMPLFLYQATTELRRYSRIIVFDRLAYMFCIVGIVALGWIEDYRLAVLANVTCALASMTVAVWSARRFLLVRSRVGLLALGEVRKNVVAGVPLLVSNVAGMLVIAVVRQAVEVEHGIEAFAKLSLALSAANFAMVFVAAVGSVVFPLVRRSGLDEWVRNYSLLRGLLAPVLFALLLAYWPMAAMVRFWLPEFQESADYLLFILPMLIYEARQGLLVAPFMKALRLERQLLVVNLLALVVSVGSSVLLIDRGLDVWWGAVFILGSIVVRGVIAEFLLCRVAGVRPFVLSAVELALVCFFIVSYILLEPFTASVAYLALFSAYVLAFRKSFLGSWRRVVGVVRGTR